jgi:hypothetical protein
MGHRRREPILPAFSVDRFREPHLAHILDRARFYDRLSVEILGRSVGHRLLLLYNLLNALFLADLTEISRARGVGNRRRGRSLGRPATSRDC